MSISIDVQLASDSDGIPEENMLVRWANSCLELLPDDAEFTIRIVDEAEITELNKNWRNIDQATNVLAFPSGGNPVLPGLLGDIVICAPIIMKEAMEQEKKQDAHWAHMVIHGLLHLLGYDHINDDDANTMESLEIEFLDKLNYPNPY